MKLKNAVVGQRVELKVKCDELEVGSTGTIVNLITPLTPPIGVQWDDLTAGHNCSGATTIARSGWYVEVDQIRKLKEPKPKEIVVGSLVRRNNCDLVENMVVPVGAVGTVIEDSGSVWVIKFDHYPLNVYLLKNKVDLVK